MIKVQEDNFKDYHRQLSGMKARLTMGTAIMMMGSMYLVNNHFYGKIIATLPFQPIGMVSNMSHRGIDGDNMSQVSMTFIYILLQMATRGCASKITGSEGPRMPIEH
jgi:hypothetical protein